MKQSTVVEFSRVFQQFNDSFDYELRPIKSIGDKVEMCLIDVGSGSDTRLMVRQVLEWSKKRAEEENGGEGERFGDSLFGALKELNGKVHKEMMTSNRAVNG